MNCLKNNFLLEISEISKKNDRFRWFLTEKSKVAEVAFFHLSCELFSA